MTYFSTIILSHLRIAFLCVALIGLSQPVAAMGGNSHDMMSQQSSTDSHCSDKTSEQDTSEKSCCDLGNCDPSCMGISATLGTILDFSINYSPQSLKDHFINHMIAVVLTSDLPPPQA